MKTLRSEVSSSPFRSELARKLNLPEAKLSKLKINVHYESQPDFGGGQALINVDDSAESLDRKQFEAVCDIVQQYLIERLKGLNRDNVGSQIFGKEKN